MSMILRSYENYKKLQEQIFALFANTWQKFVNFIIFVDAFNPGRDSSPPDLKSSDALIT